VLADLDARIERITRRIENRRKYAEDLDDDDERQHLAAETRLLLQQRRDLEAERAKTSAHYASWHQDEAGLQRTMDWCQRWGQNLDHFTFAERRDTLLTLKVDVRLYRKDHTPRAELTLVLPLSGALTLDLADAHSDEKILMIWSRASEATVTSGLTTMAKGMTQTR
ncbi:MAG TPA: hypothetical protein VF916_01275, partial [Ktedonobacterales bacterium]